MRYNHICRVCLGEGVMSKIFGTEEFIGNISMSCKDMLLACATVTISETDGFPSQICEICFKNLCSAYKFRQLCESSFSILLNNAGKFLNKGEIKKEGDDEYASNLADIFGDDIKYEDDSFKEELGDDGGECDGNSPDFENTSSPIILKPSKAIRRMERDRKKMKKASKEKLKMQKEKPLLELLTCSICLKTFKWKYLLVAHQESHIGIKRYFCEICGKYYRNEKDHRNMHKRGHNHKCDICSKCFNTKAKLNLHVEIHSSDRKKFGCKIKGCKKSFLSLGGLERHLLFHSGLKNFICHLCSKSFIDKYQLEIHIRSHTNERPYSCSYCSKSFITSSARSFHERWHNNIKNYQCTYCDKSFVSSSGRKRHLLIHSKEQLKFCRFCGKKFSRDDNKKRHEMAMHGVSDDKNPPLLFV